MNQESQKHDKPTAGAQQPSCLKNLAMDNGVCVKMHLKHGDLPGGVAASQGERVPSTNKLNCSQGIPSIDVIVHPGQGVCQNKITVAVATDVKAVLEKTAA